MANQKHFIRRESFQDETKEEEQEKDPPDAAMKLEEQLSSFRRQWREELQAVTGSSAGSRKDKAPAVRQGRESPLLAAVNATPGCPPIAVLPKVIRPHRSSTEALPTVSPVVDPKPASSGAQGRQSGTVDMGTSKQQQQQLPATKENNAREKPAGKTEAGNANRQPVREDTIEKKAKELFIQGVNAERVGNFTEAICKYRHAIQLVPDVESRITDYTTSQSMKDDDSENDIQEGYDDDEESSNADRDEMEELESELGALTTNDIKSHCEPEFQQTSTHISALPVELLLYIFRWVVSGDLDLRSLELLSSVCRGFYVCSRDPSLWHRACLGVFGRCCLTNEYATWRQMYLERPHPNFNGVYISRNAYFRKGEADDDGLYRPWHMVEYYRYVRLFPDGSMFMYSAPEEPKLIVSKLRNQTTSLQSILVGKYRLDGDMITGVLQRENNKVYDNHLRRYIRYKRNMNAKVDTENIFYVEFVMHACGHRPNLKLEWRSYSCRTHHRPTGRTTVTDFDVDKKFKALIFSRVKSYTKTSEKPL